MSRRRTRKSRRGYVLVFIAMMAFTFFALAALVIDMGMVRLAQRQMQSATDSAALEGLRFRDGIPPYMLASQWFQQLAAPVNGVAPVPQSAYDPYDPEWSNYITSVNSNLDAIRRVLSSQMVSNIFDDDLNPNDADTSGSIGSVGQPGYLKGPGNWGAGGVVNLSGFVGNDPALAAGQLIQLPAPQQRTYNPGQQNTADGNPYDPLQTNLVTVSSTSSQEPYGDMVSGTYGESTQAEAYDNAYGSWAVYPWEETAKGTAGPYDRRDFAPELAPVGNEPAFLVRMRRLNLNDIQPGIDSVSGVSTYGPPLPFLFALGSMMLPTTSSSYQPRVDGLTVRATGIGNAAPVVSVGPAIIEVVDESTTVSVDGLGAFALHQSFWNQGFVDSANDSSPPFTAFQVDAIEATDTTISLIAMPNNNDSVLPPIWQSNISAANPIGLTVAVDQELMLVTAYSSTASNEWTVQRGVNNTSPAKHAAGVSPNGQIVLPIQPDTLGNLVDVPVLSTGAPIGSAILSPIAGTGHAFATASGQFAVVVPSNTTGSPPVVASAVTSTSSAIVNGSTTWTFNLSASSSSLIPAGTLIDLICPVAAIGQDDAQFSVVMPAGYLPDHTDPGRLTSEMILAAVLDPSNPSSTLEYIRVRSQSTQTQNYNGNILCGASGSFNTCLWTVDRGLLGTEANQSTHTSSTTIVRPIAGVAIMPPQGIATLGDPLTLPTGTLSASLGTIAPLFEDLGSSMPTGTTLPLTATARIIGFGRALPLSSSAPQSGSAFPLAAIRSAVVLNSSSSFLTPFANDLQQDSEQSPSSGVASLGDLWQAIITVTQGPPPNDLFRFYPLNQAAIPGLVSTNVPPLQQ